MMLLDCTWDIVGVIEMVHTNHRTGCMMLGFRLAAQVMCGYKPTSTWVHDACMIAQSSGRQEGLPFQKDER